MARKKLSLYYSVLITSILVKQIAFEIVHFHTYQTSVTLTLDRVIWHTVVYHSSTSVYIANFVQIGKTVLWMDVWTLRPTLLGRTNDAQFKI